MSGRILDLGPGRGCQSPSPHTLRRYLAGELPPDEWTAVEEHIEACLDCAALLAEMRTEDETFKTTMPFERFAADFERRRGARSSTGWLQQLWPSLRWPVAASAGLAAAALALFLVWPAAPGPDGGIRSKGSEVQLGFLIKEDQGVRRGVDGERLQPGDRIQFLVRPDREARSMVLVGVDGRGAVTVYAAEALHGQVKGDLKPRLLPGSIILDDAIGQERFFAIFSRSLDPEQLHQRAQSAALELAASGADLAAIEVLPLDSGDLVQASVSILKVQE